MGKKVVAFIAVGLVVLLAGTALGAPAVAGHLVVSRLSAQTAALQSSFPGLGIEEQVERGLFSTTRTVKLRIGCAPVPAPDGKVARSGPLELSWRDHIQHGPLPGGKGWGLAVIDSELLLPESAVAEVKPLLDGKSPLTARTEIGFDRKFSSAIAIPSMKGAPGPGAELDWSGLRAHVTGTFPDGKGPFPYRFSTDPLSLSAVTPEATVRYEVGRTEMTGTVHYDPDVSGFVMPFENRAGVGALEMSTTAPNPEGGPPITIELAFTGIQASAESKIEKELWSMSSRMSSALAVNGFTVDKLEFASAMRRIHVPTYAQLMSSMLAMSFSCDPQLRTDDPAVAMAVLTDPAFALLAHDPEYEVGPIAMEFGGKRAELSYSVGTKGITPADKAMPLPMLLMFKSVVRAQAKADQRLIDDLAGVAGKTLAGGTAQPQAAPAQPGEPNPMTVLARGMVDEFVKEGYLVREGDMLSAIFESAAGEFKLNGKPIALDELGLRDP